MQNVRSDMRRSGVDRQDEAPNVAVAQKGYCLLTEVLSLSKEGSLLGGVSIKHDNIFTFLEYIRGTLS